MKPIEFKQQTIVLQKPSSMSDEECSPLAIHQTENGECISCWTATLKERIKFLFTGRIWLWVVSGRAQPPVYVGIETPFKEKHS